MTIVICPGIHPPELTQSFWAGLKASAKASASGESCAGRSHLSTKVLVFPADEPAYSAFHILRFVQYHCEPGEPLLFLSFSAGVVGAIGAAWSWRALGRSVKAVIALDGWGVALYGDFPVHRLSHDYMTHWSSSLLGAGESAFYADPAIAHLQFWQSPQTTLGWEVNHQGQQRTTQAQFLLQLLEIYGEHL